MATNPVMDRMRMRRIIAEDPTWSLDLIPALSTLCLQSIVTNFERNPVLEDLPVNQRTFVLDQLSPALPLRVTANYIADGVYWKRCCQLRWGVCDLAAYGHSWKRMYMEKHLEHMIEHFVPGVTDPKNIVSLVPLCNSYISRLEITQLLPPVKEQLRKGRNNAFPQIDHFDFRILLAKLTSLEELDITYRVKQCGMNFEWSMFEVTNRDCEYLAEAVESCKTLKLLRLSNSHLRDEHCRTLVKQLYNHPTLIHLDLSYNLIADVGGKAVGKLLTRCKLETVTLIYNNIGERGAEVLATALTKNTTLLSLNLRLNQIKDVGGQAICEALLRNDVLLHLHLGANQLTWITAEALAKVLKHNQILKSINLSCNKLGPEGGRVLQEAIAENTTLTEFDLSKTDIDQESADFIEQVVSSNRLADKKKQS
ncbi:dynein regulatory complex subunit 5 [Synchiropus picturatus]